MLWWKMADAIKSTTLDIKVAPRMLSTTGTEPSVAILSSPSTSRERRASAVPGLDMCTLPSFKLSSVVLSFLSPLIALVARAEWKPIPPHLFRSENGRVPRTVKTMARQRVKGLAVKTKILESNQRSGLGSPPQKSSRAVGSKLPGRTRHD